MAQAGAGVSGSSFVGEAAVAGGGSAWVRLAGGVAVMAYDVDESLPFAAANASTRLDSPMWRLTRDLSLTARGSTGSVRSWPDLLREAEKVPATTVDGATFMHMPVEPGPESIRRRLGLPLRSLLVLGSRPRHCGTLVDEAEGRLPSCETFVP